jgi:aspartyl-tRNA(Asn)/glutamyl-tRNA(Gln) amidotransferase subunit B
MKKEDFEAVIGLEIHVELNTRSKMFSPAPNHFGDEPNTNISFVCTAQPGSLPVVNKEAVKKAVQLGCAIGSKIELISYFDRKSYFYPDSPRNFQITQFERPILVGGSVVAEVDGVEMSFPVRSAHLEDDTGMLKHFTKFAGIDFNRAGVPLIEIVSEPCFRSPKEAVAYAMGLKAILEYIDASDCNMDEGSLRMDANVSVRLKGETALRNKIEIKNMNSFTNMQLALDQEISRQIEMYITHPDQVIQQSTYRWDPDQKKTILMRKKERAEDYRYFPEPDLPPLVITKEFIEEIRSNLQELPKDRLHRYVKELGLSEHHAFVLVADKPTSDYFEKALNIFHSPKLLSNWILVEFQGRFKEKATTLAKSGLAPAHLAELIELIEKGTITGRIAKDVADLMVLHPHKSPKEIVAENPNFAPVHDTELLEPIIEKVLANNQQSIIDYQNGKNRAFGFLVGQVMKETQGKASPEVVNKLILSKISQK